MSLDLITYRKGGIFHKHFAHGLFGPKARKVRMLPTPKEPQRSLNFELANWRMLRQA
jgi:hypothetical protein